MLYVLGMDNHLHLRDLTARYASKFLTKTFRSLRTDEAWWKETLILKLFTGNKKKCVRDSIEDLEIRRYLESLPLPAMMADFKNHPLYVLEKDLLKFEAIYPPDIKPIAEFRGHKVLPRSAVHVLQGDLNWIRQARTVKKGEKPYKVVKARPKLAIPKEKRVPLTLDVYGFWQTEPYIPPEVVDGKIPRNEHGNVYMYQPQMVPKGCVHLNLPGIFYIARKLDIEAVQAVTGWEFHGARNVPQIEGCVILKKDEKVLRDAWNEMQQRKRERESKKVEERVWKNWRRLIKGKLLLEKMRSRFVK
uniref:Uncharacterized protein n=1 Tax=Acrobeloides nanus TaxID=290746 RepID=A0A914EAE3_9BILA